DPNYALAYAGLADGYCLLAFFGLLPPSEAMPKAKAAALRAVELDDSLADGHTSLACMLEAYDWDWPAAEAEFRRALELNPNHPTAHRFYADYLTAAGRTDEAMAEIQRAQELDPLSVVIQNELAWNFAMARQYDRAIEQCHETIAMEPAFAPAHHILADCYHHAGRHEEALASFERALELNGNSPSTLASYGYVLAAQGRAAEARRILDQLSEMAGQGRISPYLRALVHAGLDEREAAIDCLGECHAKHDVALIFLKMEPNFDRLRSDPRFEELMRRVFGDIA
ncbi:MAG TPA: tetratricopeptide repeat protein, partial [Terriglobia bacterium]|nr:tetratricopeptide repeat protein [Terriglobia bacterium]